MTSSSRFDTAAYWRNRLAGADLAAVGNLGLSLAFNRHQYAARVQTLDRLDLDVSGRRILDVGCGAGFWIEYWLARKAASVAGVEFDSQTAASTAARYPAAHIAHSDVTRGLAVDGRFDVVTAIDVLLHIIDDDIYLAALANIRQVVEPGAKLVLMEPVTLSEPRPYEPGLSSKVRSLGWLDQAMRDTGWRIEIVRPALWLMANPIETAPATVCGALRMWWRACAHAARREAPGRIVGGLVRPVDSVLCRMRWGPTSKLIVARAV